MFISYSFFITNKSKPPENKIDLQVFSIGNFMEIKLERVKLKLN